VRYQCRFLNHADQVFSFACFEANGDPEAIRHALTVYWNGVGKGFEVWRGNRLLRSIRYGQSVASEPAPTEKG